MTPPAIFFHQEHNRCRHNCKLQLDLPKITKSSAKSINYEIFMFFRVHSKKALYLKSLAKLGNEIMAPEYFIRALY